MSAFRRACPQHDPALGESFRPGRADVLELENLEQARPGHPHQNGGDRHPQRDGRQHERPDPGSEIAARAHPAERWQPPQGQREDQDQQHRQPEARQGDTGDGHQRGRHVHHRVAAERSQDSGGKADRERYEQRGHGQAQRHGCSLANRVHDRLVRADGPSELALDRAPEPRQVLQWKGLIEAKLVPERRHRGRVRLLAEHDTDWVPRREVDQGEHNDAHDPEDRHDRTGTAEQVAEHATASARPARAVDGHGPRMAETSGRERPGGRRAADHTDGRRRGSLTDRAKPAPNACVRRGSRRIPGPWPPTPWSMRRGAER